MNGPTINLLRNPWLRMAVLGLGLLVRVSRAADPEEAARTIDRKLADSLAELADVRETIARDKIRLSEELHRLENERIEAQKEYETVKRQLDRRSLDMNNLRNEIKTREQEKAYLSNLLGEYIRNFETRLHIVELARYQEQIETARLAPENSDLQPSEVFSQQAALVATSLERLEELLGGVRFEGRAAGEDGLVKRGHFVLFGPVAHFASEDGALAGIAEQRLGSLEPSVAAFTDPLLASATRAFVENGEGAMPIDSSLGNARKVEETRETLSETIRKGGIMMVPILAVAAATILYSLGKLIGLLYLRVAHMPSSGRIKRLLQAIATGDIEAARRTTAGMTGPAGAMLKAGAAHLHEPKELIEDAMFEKLLDTRYRLRGLIPFVAVSAASAPLMGLLGTVMGIIDTFKMLTVFGSGDVKALSGGISVALITTQFGLILAIPALVFHAVLSSVSKAYTEKMEKLAIAVLNAVVRARAEQEAAAKGELAY